MKYFSLDLFRGFAALWVFAFHYGFSAEFKSVFSELTTFLNNGHLGVPIFFVISGYCITASARSAISKDTPTKTFVFRRLRRIYPTFWFSILAVITIPFVMTLLSYLKTGDFLLPAREDWGFLNFDFWHWLRIATLTEIFAVVPDASNLSDKFTQINAPYWSLAIEVQFYLAVALCLLLPRKYFSTSFTVITLCSIATQVLGMPTIWGIFLNSWLGFALGGLVAVSIEKNWIISDKHNAILRKATCLLGLLTLLGMLSYAAVETHVNHLVFEVAFAFALWAIRPLDLIIPTLRQNSLSAKTIKLLSLTGVISYSVYLLHGKLMHLCAMILRQLLKTDTILFDMSVISLTCLLCLPFYYLCEKPFASSAKKKKQQELSALATD
ncbi:acyltransferase [bacterium]|nr:acyltransferase [bacterium]